MRINDLGIRNIDQNLEKMVKDIIEAMLQAVEVVAKELMELMQQRTHNATVSASIQKEVTLIGFERIEALVGSDHWAAFLDNYGTGSAMLGGNDNPYLAEYKAKYWNPVRKTTTVVGRPAGDYTAPNYATGSGEVAKTSKGRYEGRDLESAKGKVRFTPTTPSYFVENSMIYIEKRFEDAILKALEDFDVSLYFTMKGE